MKYFAILAAFALVGCQGIAGPIPASPSAVANQTVLDEKTAIGAELAYKAARTALELAVDLGRVRGDAAATAIVLDSKAYAALGKVRAAYRAGNAASYAAAAAEAHALVGEMLNLIG